MAQGDIYYKKSCIAKNKMQMEHMVTHMKPVPQTWTKTSAAEENIRSEWSNEEAAAPH